MTLFSVNRQPHILSMGLLLCCRLAMKDIFFTLSLALTFLFIYPSSLWSSTNMSAPSPFMILSFFAFIELLWFFDAQKYTILHSVFSQQTKKTYHICNLCLNSYISLTWCCNNLWESVYSQILKFWIWFWREWKISVASEVTVFSLFTRYCTFDKASSSSYLYLF